MSKRMSTSDRIKAWEKIAEDTLADPKSDSAMLRTCYFGLHLSRPDLAERCKKEAERRHKTIKVN